MPVADRLAARLASVVLLCSRRAGTVLLGALALGGLCAVLASTRLAVTTDLDRLFAASLPWKQNEAELKRLFPQTTDLLVAVVSADSPEEADLTAAGLAAILSADTTHFRTVRRPDASAYFDQNGLLFLDEATLGRLLDQTIDAQPFLGQLATDPRRRSARVASRPNRAGRRAENRPACRAVRDSRPTPGPARSHVPRRATTAPSGTAAAMPAGRRRPACAPSASRCGRPATPAAPSPPRARHGSGWR